MSLNEGLQKMELQHSLKLHLKNYDDKAKY